MPLQAARNTLLCTDVTNLSFGTIRFHLFDLFEVLLPRNIVFIDMLHLG